MQKWPKRSEGSNRTNQRQTGGGRPARTDPAADAETGKEEHHTGQKQDREQRDLGIRLQLG
jgi:hypothetical protein